MIDVVYILGDGSTWDNNEIRYSLRSLCDNLENYGNVFIVGNKPDFIDFGEGCYHIHHVDNMGYTKERRIMEKVKFACSIPEISDSFLFMNDDIFFSNRIDAPTMPTYYKGTLIASAKRRSNDRYRRALLNCHDSLLLMGYDALNYDTHAPIIYNKEAFIEIMSQFDWKAARDGFVVKSAYANVMQVGGLYQPDCKIDSPMLYSRIKDKVDNRDFFNIGDLGLNDHMIAFLADKYPDKSAWEK